MNKYLVQVSSENFLLDAVDSFHRSRTIIIFDYDSTVARIPVDWIRARDECRAYLNKHFTGVAIKPGMRVDEMENLALLAYPGSHESIFAYRTKIESEVSGKHQPINETVSFIERESTRTLYILSNNLRSTVLDGLNQFNIAGSFEEVAGVDDTLSPKPSISALNFFLRVDPNIVSKAIFVGDSDRTDGEFCARAGIPFINILSKEVRANKNRYA